MRSRLSAGRSGGAARAGSAGRPAPGSPGRWPPTSAGTSSTGVKPGIVLTSLTTTSPSRSRKKSTRARPSQPSASNARTARSRDPARHVVREVGRAAQPHGAPRRGTWPRSRRTRARADAPRSRRAALVCGRPPSSASSTPHSISRPTIAASTTTFGSCSRAASIAASRSAGSVHLGDADARAGPGRLDEHRPAQRRDRLHARPSGSRCHCRGGDDDWYGPTGSPAPASSTFMYVLVHAGGRGEHARSRRSGTSASSSSPCSVPSSPNGPCSSGNTTSTSPSVARHLARARARSAPRSRRARRHQHARAVASLDLGQLAAGELPAAPGRRRPAPSARRW